ncbi:DNA-processing protein DprA [Thiomicrorhabdus arctica]|uniref:DNA-processing protein DprA n=1 Tax=Thiomicrorhabdus arctica TaxID=131540 RepID=UPI00036E50C6|nr:DNA-processing protein DprA [Thiomicrorhabdus arctica]
MSNFSDLPSFDLPSLLALHLSHVSLKQLQDILVYFGSISTAVSAGEAEWRNSEILSKKQLESFMLTERAGLVDLALEWAERPLQSYLPIGSAGYPELLASIDDAPILLSVRGNVALLKDPQLAIVGSRHASKQGVNIAKDFAQHLSNQGLTITSGLALGIDAAAHQGGLQGLGKTVAVIGTGLDRIYPAANQALARQIAEEGVMISEFPLGTPPLAFNFPRRNRIISGLSVGTLVVEAALKSGSLITAKTAIEQGREVFAVPGSINNPLAKGCHQLIKQGAKLVESGQDVFEELSALIQFSLEPQQTVSNSKQLPFELQSKGNKLDSSKQPILEHIGYEPIGLDELAVLSKSPVSAIQGQLIMLELSGDIEAMSAGRWRRIS